MISPARNAPRASEAPAAAVPRAVSVPMRMTAIQKELAACVSSRSTRARVARRARSQDDADERPAPPCPAPRAANRTAGRCPREEGQDQHDRHHAEILENEDAGREPAVRRVDLSGVR